MRKFSKNPHSSNSSKPAKPYPDFPLTAHPSGRWCKKIRGRLHYFGRWGNKVGKRLVPVEAVDVSAQQAVDLYNEQRDDLYAGRTPRVKTDGLTVAELCNRFLTSKQASLDTGEIKVQTWKDYYKVCGKLVSVFGRNRLVNDLAADDFEALRREFSRGRGPVSLAKDVRLSRIIFKYGYDAGLIDRPVRFGPQFKQPAKRILRQARQQNGKRMFEAEELGRIIGAAKQPLKAMILLAINGGLGQSDLANLPEGAVNLELGWVDHPRVKTAVERRFPLWKETAEAVRDAIAERPEAKHEDDAGLLFITKFGNRYVRDSLGPKRAWIDSVGLEFGKLLRQIGINGPRNFYAIRHSFRTVADGAKDQPAADYVMGHVRDDMASLYREQISDERLRAVVEYVRAWLFSPSGTAAPAKLPLLGTESTVPAASL
jgi:integrase